jgi:uncharacterized membrane protein
MLARLNFVKLGVSLVVCLALLWLGYYAAWHFHFNYPDIAIGALGLLVVGAYLCYIIQSPFNESHPRWAVLFTAVVTVVVLVCGWYFFVYRNINWVDGLIGIGLSVIILGFASYLAYERSGVEVVRGGRHRP